MTIGSWLSVLVRQAGPGVVLGWDEMVVGHDFGLLPPEEIQAWTLEQGHTGEACLALAALAGDGMIGFEAALWRACAEATGRVPRPGGNRWARAQDRWRVALLKDALESPLSAEALAVLLESIYDTVGCPEDMLGLWRRPAGPAPKVADPGAVTDFIKRCEAYLRPA